MPDIDMVVDLGILAFVVGFVTCLLAAMIGGVVALWMFILGGLG